MGSNSVLLYASLHLSVFEVQWSLSILLAGLWIEITFKLAQTFSLSPSPYKLNL